MAGNIISGYFALLAIAVTIIYNIKLPEDVKVHTEIERPWQYSARFVVTIIMSASLTALIINNLHKEVEYLRNIALLGGLGPGLFLFFPVLILLLFLQGKYMVYKYRRQGKYKSAPQNVAFLVAALNEAEHIEDCIMSLDRAAGEYSGSCRLYLVDNGSKDETCELAIGAINKCKYLDVVLLDCPNPGKSYALNLGLKHIKEDIVVRIDADTKVKKDIIPKILSHFSVPDVGGVGGLPLPKSTKHIFTKMRAIEVYYNIGLFRLGQSSVDAVVVIPGIMAAYRRELLEKLGGFVEGINGEDTDITMRIGRMGYRIVIDPSIIVYSEAPNSLSHLREQRLRWSRSYLHVFARNKSSIYMAQGARGLWFIPFGFIAAFRRAVVVPILIFALIVALVDPTVLYLRNGAAIASVIIGPVFLLTAFVLLIYRRLDLIPYIPAYFALRLFRAYMGLEMLFTNKLKETKISMGINKIGKQEANMGG